MVRLPWETSVNLPDKFRHILSLFPQEFVFAFSYGSGAFQQHGHKSIEVSKDQMKENIQMWWDIEVISGCLHVGIHPQPDLKVVLEK